MIPDRTISPSRSLCQHGNDTTNRATNATVTPRAFWPGSATAVSRTAQDRQPREGKTAMFIGVRKYRGVRSVDEVRRRVEQEFIPMLKQNPGFLGYY